MTNPQPIDVSALRGDVVFRRNRPSGTVTFLFTDIEGSTRRWEADPEAMRLALDSSTDGK